MKLNRAEKAALVLTAVFVALLAGYHFGVRGGEDTFVIITAETSGTPAAVSAAAVDSSPVPTAQPESLTPGCIDLNSADAEALTALPQIGEVLAGRILAYREEHGAFQSTDDIMNVRGIGEKIFAEIEEYITVTGAEKGDDAA